MSVPEDPSDLTPLRRSILFLFDLDFGADQVQQ
jgi:hypothetical protein